MIKNKIFLAIMILLIGVLTAGVVLADPNQTTATAPPQGNAQSAAGADPVTVVGNFYKLALMVSGFLAFAMIVFGAFKYTIAAGNPSGQSDAKDTILQALLGLLLLLGAYIILQTINPAILSTQIPGLAPLQAPLTVSNPTNNQIGGVPVTQNPNNNGYTTQNSNGINLAVCTERGLVVSNNGGCVSPIGRKACSGNDAGMCPRGDTCQNNVCTPPSGTQTINIP